MDPERFARLRELLLTLPRLPEAERRACLERACAGDDELRREAESLLALDLDTNLPDVLRTGGVLGVAGRHRSAGPGPPHDPAVPREDSPLPKHIGPFRVLGMLGQGGMAVVYRAEQIEPIRREVAVKLIAPGMGGRAALRRFEMERQALALMEHPGIARVLDAGEDDGRPYFVMELVRGVPITEFCQAGNLDLVARLRLFVDVCRAVQHAHQKGIIHRDLKPSNILVTMLEGKPAPKVIDFGIAKALDEGEIPALTVTREGQLVGTLEYMSPEQAGGRTEAIDTRSDVYSLGVVLYELIARALPYDVAGRPLVEAARVIAEKEPDRLASTVNGDRVDRDLTTITLKALDKEPDRRYASAATLADDIERYLQGMPVLAHPPSTIYQLRKLVARNRVPATLLAALATLLVVFLVSTSIQLEGQRRERARAEAEAEKATRINAFLNDMLASVDPAEKGTDVTVRAVLDEAAAEVESGLATEPEVQAAVRQTIGNTYRALGLYDPAEAQLKAALRIREEVLGPSHPEALRTANDLSTVFRQEKRIAAAESLLRHEMEAGRDVLAADLNLACELLVELSNVLVAQGRYAEAESLAAKAVAALPEAGSPERIDAISALAVALDRQGKFEEAERYTREALAWRQQALGPNHPHIAFSLTDLGLMVLRAGRLDEAESLAREALDLRLHLYGEDHASVALSLTNLGVVLKKQGQMAAAESLYARALAINRRLLDGKHPRIAHTLHSMAGLRLAQGDPAAAERLAREAVSILRSQEQGGHPFLPEGVQLLARCLEAQGRTVEAEASYREALAMRRRTQGATHPAVAGTLDQLAALLSSQGREGEAEALRHESQAIREGHPGSRRMASASEPRGDE